MAEKLASAGEIKFLQLPTPIMEIWFLIYEVTQESWQNPGHLSAYKCSQSVPSYSISIFLRLNNKQRK